MWACFMIASMRSTSVRWAAAMVFFSPMSVLRVVEFDWGFGFRANAFPVSHADGLTVAALVEFPVEMVVRLLRLA